MLATQDRTVPKRRESLGEDGEIQIPWRKLALFLALPVVLIIAAICVLPYDVLISKFCFVNPSSRIRFIEDILERFETFGHGVGVIAICIAVALLDRENRRAAITVATASLGGGILADIVKLVVGRTRPRGYDFESMSTWDTFQGVFQEFSVSGASHSFPSAHSATAAGLAFALCYFYPKGTGLFILSAVLVAYHRIHFGAHYASDVFVGLSLGYLWGVFCCYGPMAGWLTKLADRLPNWGKKLAKVS
ncbi:phosphatase PAP2 family protein [Calycomorphotria hydatis]|uniref:PAP2 superfamily protein n=1 Tax=Calycomorphotria hydatis TaxID=2528027 RepID=A0A517T6A8_9PLAN|nr:phosphatase PAP2 family protein [Calycomorphotria hydatis]QDT63916.1 PAP2 superfamily protein [Calycomorphotria hydatis]